MPETPKDEAPQKRGKVPPFRFAIGALSVLLTLFFMWLLSFAVSDISDLPGRPIYKTFEQEHVPAAQLKEQAALEAKRRKIQPRIDEQESLRETLQQKMNVTERALRKEAEVKHFTVGEGTERITAKHFDSHDALPEDKEQLNRKALRESFNRAQSRFEAVSQNIETLREERDKLDAEISRVKEELAPHQEKAKALFNAAKRRHQLNVASLKIGLLVPLLALAAWLTWRQWNSPYQPIYRSALVATFLWVCSVVHTHFPSEYFKYIALLAAIGTLIAVLAMVIRAAINPSEATLQKRLQKAYQQHRCPVCDFPIQRDASAAARQDDTHATVTRESAYTCPSCGSTLFAVCESCSKIRRALFPFCDACGHGPEPAQV